MERKAFETNRTTRRSSIRYESGSGVDAQIPTPKRSPGARPHPPVAGSFFVRQAARIMANPNGAKLQSRGVSDEKKQAALIAISRPPRRCRGTGDGTNRAAGGGTDRCPCAATGRCANRGTGASADQAAAKRALARIIGVAARQPSGKADGEDSGGNYSLDHVRSFPILIRLTAGGAGEKGNSRLDPYQSPAAYS